MATRHDVVTHPFTINFVQIKAAQLCRRSDFSRSDDAELQQGMLLYLWKKAHLFDPARGNIEAFVTTALKSWVGMELRRRARFKRRCDCARRRSARPSSRRYWAARRSSPTRAARSST